MDHVIWFYYLLRTRSIRLKSTIEVKTYSDLWPPIVSMTRDITRQSWYQNYSKSVTWVFRQTISCETFEFTTREMKLWNRLFNVTFHVIEFIQSQTKVKTHLTMDQFMGSHSLWYHTVLFISSCSTVKITTKYFRPDEVKAHFAQFGHIRDVHIPIDFNTRKPRGFAYIE